MPVTDSLDLPIKRIAIDGPAVREHEARKEENNHPRAQAAELNERYDVVRGINLDAFTSLGERSYGI